ncbi:class I SAM-dependent methyltransferase [Agromyces sp. G08B096]|uniref:Class I SAM-dependent methyltransferase n=1 Tax=Agromyces sp. G08B096 TaxID=3156399 RepID=A0AAU7W8J6_9MICO
MGEQTDVRDAVRRFVEDASSFADLDAELWEPISLATILRSDPQLGELVLDACCGDGASAVPTAELVGPDGLVDAVDVAAPMIELARARAAALGAGRGEGAAGDLLPQLSFHVADVAEWQTEGYDLVQCVLGVFFFDDLDAGARQLVSRAKPGGRVAITLWGADAFSGFTELLVSAVEAEAGEDAVAGFRERMQRHEEPGTAGALAHWLHTLGLVDVRAEEVPRHLDLDDDLAWRLVLGTGRQRLVADLDDETRERVRGRFVAALRDHGVARVDIGTIVGVGRRPEEPVAPA